MSAPQKIIIGLGNPDEQHAGTRHNIGWMVADVVADGADWKNDKKLFAEVAQAESALIAKPTTYMNESGTAVGAISRYYKVGSKHILVISDDINLPFGEVRFRDSGGAGGQNGLKDVIQKLGTEDFPRLRVGVGEPPTDNATPHVLGKFSKEEREQLPQVITDAHAKVMEWLRG